MNAEENKKEEPPYLEKIVTTTEYSYNPKYGDDRICKCGHSYYRHFDTYEQMSNVGCKYCQCHHFEERISPFKEQTIEFKFKDKDFKFSFTPEEGDYWTSFTQDECTFDAHYLEDEDNDICVYLVVDGNAQTDKTLHKQKIQ